MLWCCGFGRGGGASGCAISALDAAASSLVSTFSDGLMMEEGSSEWLVINGSLIRDGNGRCRRINATRTHLVAVMIFSRRFDSK